MAEKCTWFANNLLEQLILFKRRHPPASVKPTEMLLRDLQALIRVFKPVGNLMETVCFTGGQDHSVFLLLDLVLCPRGVMSEMMAETGALTAKHTLQKPQIHCVETYTLMDLCTFVLQLH